jgi:hypothetical protein
VRAVAEMYYLLEELPHVQCAARVNIIIILCQHALYDAISNFYQK